VNSSGTEDGGDHLAGFLLNLLQVIGTAETFGVNFVDVFGAGRPGGEPAVFGDHLQASNGIAIARRLGKNLLNFFSGEFGDGDVRGR
jgi:hypothetical protein